MPCDRVKRYHSPIQLAPEREKVMLKALFVLPLLVFGSMLLGFGAILLLPLIAVLPVLFAVGAVIFAFTLVAGIFAVILRVFAAIFIGLGGLLIAGIGFGALFVGGVFALVLGVAFAHLLLPILLVVGLIWLIRRSARTAPPQLVGHV
jgi:hypothetical protein